jgi:outer membrane protein TolC
VGSCANNRPHPDTETAIASATGIEQAVRIRTEGGPVDEPSEGDSEVSSLTLATAVRQAVTTDPGLQAALARVRIALADADQARLLPNPVLNVVLRFDVSGGGKPQIEASLAQDIVNILRIPRQSSAADHRLRQASADAVTVALDVVAEVRERYAEAQALDRLMPVLNERHALVGKLLDAANARLRVGSGGRTCRREDSGA